MFPYILKQSISDDNHVCRSSAAVAGNMRSTLVLSYMCMIVVVLSWQNLYSHSAGHEKLPTEENVELESISKVKGTLKKPELLRTLYVDKLILQLHPKISAAFASMKVQDKTCWINDLPKSC